jgi:hypothetical protein
MNSFEKQRIKYIQQNVQILKETDSLYIYLLHQFPEIATNSKKARDNENMRKALQKIQLQVRKNLRPFQRWPSQPIY